MKEVIDKISSYNLFNYLFPGIIYVVILKVVTSYDLLQENNFVGAFLYYFIGLIISRVGSLIIGEFLQWKKLKFIKFAKYSDFVYASDKDQKIDLFTEVNNMYRTIIALIVMLLVSKLVEIIQSYFSLSAEFILISLLAALLILFVFSYRNQTSFIVKRIEARKKQNEK